MHPEPPSSRPATGEIPIPPLDACAAAAIESGPDPETAPGPGTGTGAGPRRGARPGTVGLGLAVFAVLMIAVNLRPGAASVGPLLDGISASLGVGQTYSGLLTALPGICFGAFGLLAVPIGERLGLTGAIVVGFIGAVVGLLLRPATGSPVLFVLLSVLVLAGPALANVLVPAWIKRHGGDRTVMLMTMYTITLAIGGTLGALFAVPLRTPGAEGWRDSLATWGYLGVIPVLVWVVVLTRTGHDFPPHAPGGALRGSLWRSRTAVALTVVFGLQSMNAYVQMGWLPLILQDAGIGPAAAGALASLVSACGIVGGLLLPSVIARSRHLPLIMLILGAVTAAGWAGLLIAPSSLALLWVLLLGVGGFLFSASIALIPARSRDARVTARLSGMVQPIGYVLAALGPFAVGTVHELRGDWTAILLALALIALVMGVVGMCAAAPRMVDDELAAAQAARQARP